MREVGSGMRLVPRGAAVVFASVVVACSAGSSGVGTSSGGSGSTEPPGASADGGEDGGVVAPGDDGGGGDGSSGHPLDGGGGPSPEAGDGGACVATYEGPKCDSVDSACVLDGDVRGAPLSLGATGNAFEIGLAKLGCGTPAWPHRYVIWSASPPSADGGVTGPRYAVTSCPRSAELDALVAGQPNASESMMCDACLGAPGCNFVWVLFDGSGGGSGGHCPGGCGHGIPF